MKIKVIAWNHNNINWNERSDFILEQDSWNDYSYFTSYHLHTRLIDGSEYTLMGVVKILKKGQKEFERYLLEVGEFEHLPKIFCSKGDSLDYYERMNQLDITKKNELLTSLNDIIYNQDLIDEFKDEDGFKASLLRDQNLNDDFFTLAPIILTGEYEKLPDDENLKF